MNKSFVDFKVGDEVDVIEVSQTNRGKKMSRKRTKIISEKGVRVKKYQVQHRKKWYDEGDFGKRINFSNGELSRLEW